MSRSLRSCNASLHVLRRIRMCVQCGGEALRGITLVKVRVNLKVRSECQTEIDPYLALGIEQKEALSAQST